MVEVVKLDNKDRENGGGGSGSSGGGVDEEEVKDMWKRRCRKRWPRRSRWRRKEGKEYGGGGDFL